MISFVLENITHLNIYLHRKKAVRKYITMLILAIFGKQGNYFNFVAYFLQ